MDIVDVKSQHASCRDCIITWNIGQ
jgi:hypothetical protein